MTYLKHPHVVPKERTSKAKSCFLFGVEEADFK